MSEWKPFDMVLPAQLSPREAARRLYEQVRLNATEAGDFVDEIRMEATGEERDGWQRWQVAYRPGPPSSFPALPRVLPTV
ncbi:hypothetical protein [Mycobacterium sp. NPDC050041]|jgi:hypothetical protein|uniref:hypothetical protein n=1 Tax=Mycobacterium sp. NPDC050041 TaxID=3364293 RepID=UPI003C2C082B